MTDAQDWFDTFTMELRLSGMDGKQIGATLEEAREHLRHDASGPWDVFGDPETYARALASGHELSPHGLNMTPADVVFGAVQIVGWFLLVTALFAFSAEGQVEIAPGHLAGLALLAVALWWPVWPAVRAYATRRAPLVLPLAALGGVVAPTVALNVWWDTPVLAAIPAMPAAIAAVAIIAGCWARAWRQRDPIASPRAAQGLRTIDGNT